MRKRSVAHQIRASHANGHSSQYLHQLTSLTSRPPPEPSAANGAEVSGEMGWESGNSFILRRGQSRMPLLHDEMACAHAKHENQIYKFRDSDTILIL
jgi:hypothetical protein